MQQQVYNTTSERQANDKRHSKRHSKFIRLFINNILLIIENRIVYTGTSSAVSTLFLDVFKKFRFSVLNCQAPAGFLVISLPVPLAKNSQGVASLSLAAKGRERCGDRYLPAALADTPLPYSTHSGLLISLFQLSGLRYWKHIGNIINVKH